MKEFKVNDVVMIPFRVEETREFKKDGIVVNTIKLESASAYALNVSELFTNQSELSAVNSDSNAKIQRGQYKNGELDSHES